MVRALVVIGVALVLAGCDDIPHTWSRSDIEAIATHAAEDAMDDAAPDVSELVVRIDKLEGEVERLRGDQSKDISMMAEITKADAADGRWVSESVDRLFKNDDALRARVNWLLAQQGQPGIPKVE